MLRWTRWALALALLVSLTAASSARALLVAPPMPGPDRVARADAIVVGRVVAHEDKDVEIVVPGGGKTTYRIAVVNITENVRGVKEAKAVRVAFVPPPMGGVGDPAVPIRIRPGIRPGFGVVNLEVGQDGLFFLAKHPKENFYTASDFGDVVLRSAPNFEKDLGDAKRVGKLLDNPMESLKTGSAADRFQTAALLITKYRQVRFASGKTEPIAAEESKLILKALREGNWEGAGRFDQPNAWLLFNQLGLTAKEGWTPPPARDVRDFHKAAQAWLDKNLDTYRIQRVLPGAPTGVGPGPIGPGPIILPIDLPIRPIPRPLPLPIKKIDLDR